jgi:hypothetical protein
MRANQLAEAAQIAHTCVGFTATIGIAAMAPTLREMERVIRAEGREAMTRLLAMAARVRQVRAACERESTRRTRCSGDGSFTACQSVILSVPSVELNHWNSPMST